jgi:copper homeostasis protein
MKKYKFEVCAFTIQSCLIAQIAGATRVELCDNPLEGGTTPSFGLIKLARNKINIELFPIIRPRGMNYYYDEDEWKIILEDVEMCKQIGCDGISVGVQKLNGEIDSDKMKKLVEVAYPMTVASNRVIDATPDPFIALEVLIDAGCKRVLTSGKAVTAPAGVNILKQLVQQAHGRISIMPGAGVNSSNIQQLIDTTGAHEFHGSARVLANNPVLYSNTAVADSGNMFVADFQEIQKMVEVLELRN